MAYVGPARRLQGIWCHEHWESIGYPLVSSNYHYEVQDVFVEATLTETYKAESKVEREVSYVFEIPPEASVINFSAQVGNTLVEAIVDEKAEANKKYQQAKAAGFQAWKLDKVNDEVFQIGLGYVSPNTTTTIRVTYVYVISSDTLEDSLRLTIPAGLAGRPGASPASQTTVPTAPAGTNAVTITVGIEARPGDHVFGVTSLAHLATIMHGFSNNSYKRLSPVKMQQASDQSRAYVEFTSNQFLRHHFVLVWTVARVDHARCVVERLSPSIPNRLDTMALALTMVSNVDLNPEEHEYIFLVDYSGSMAGARIQTANQVVGTMLRKLPSQRRSSFNIYNFNTSAWSVIPGERSLGYDINNLSTALGRLGTNATGGTNINTALTHVLSRRDQSKPRCSVIVISDGLDWGVTAAMQTVQKNVTAAAAQSRLLRVFVMGIGDDVSRGMCEALARAGAGATAYISESSLADRDHRDEKARTLVKSINRAPIRVRSINWGVAPITTQGGGSASGDNLDSRREPDDDELGAVAKGDNLPPPPAIQQAPKPGTMFWAVRSYWYAIVNGNLNNLEATITYDIPGSTHGIKTIHVGLDFRTDGRRIHAIAARALIQTFEDKAASITDATEKYWNEAEIVRLGKTYGLASTQTSFVATMNNVGRRTNVNSNAPPASQSLLSSVPTNNTSNLGFVDAQAPSASARNVQTGATSFAARSMRLAVRDGEVEASSAIDSASSPGDDLSEIISVQEGNGSFDPSTVERIAFPGTGIPAVPAFISNLGGSNNIKDQIWLAVCVIAFFKTKHADRSSEWSEAESKAKKFVEKTLCCVFGVDSAESQRIFTNSLDDAEGYFY